jgi:hypothetical protein
MSATCRVLCRCRDRCLDDARDIIDTRDMQWRNHVSTASFTCRLIVNLHFTIKEGNWVIKPTLLPLVVVYAYLRTLQHITNSQTKRPNAWSGQQHLSSCRSNDLFNSIVRTIEPSPLPISANTQPILAPSSSFSPPRHDLSYAKVWR